MRSIPFPREDNSHIVIDILYSYQFRIRYITEKFHARGRASRGKSAGDIRCMRIFIAHVWQENFDLENVCQRHEVQYLQWRHSITTINLYKNDIWAFFASFQRLRD